MALKETLQKNLQKIVDDWNAKHPIGTAVVLRRGNQDFHTRTRAAAELLDGHIPVVHVDGLSGRYALGHITAI